MTVDGTPNLEIHPDKNVFATVVAVMFAKRNDFWPRCETLKTSEQVCITIGWRKWPDTVDVHITKSIFRQVASPEWNCQTSAFIFGQMKRNITSLRVTFIPGWEK